VKPDDQVVHGLFSHAQAEASIAKGDIACTFCPSYPLRFLSHLYSGWRQR